MVGRLKEKDSLLRALASEYSEFVAVYGRRRVGKTFLIRETFNYKFTFQHSGIKNGGKRIQLARFRKSLVAQGLAECPVLKDWFDAFDALRDLIAQSSDRRKVVFIDEMPWLGRKDRTFVSAVEDFWNGWASARKDVLFIVCGSATSWILDKIVHSRDGLHNRVTYRIPLRPFTLRECELYAESMGLELPRAQIAECYMVLGGIPYYWHYLQRGLSVAQNIDSLFFAGEDKLENEFYELYSSLFSSPQAYIRIITALGSKKSGMTREELSQTAGVANNGALTRRLKELEQCGFIRSFTEIGKRKKGAVHQLIDNLTLFHFRFFAENLHGDRHFWSEMTDSHIHSTWIGLAFERLCLEHLDQIKEALRIGGVKTNAHAWRGTSSQIDLLIDRNDGIVNLCEIKYHDGRYPITKDDDDAMRNKKSEFKEETETRKAVHVTYITPFGIKDNVYARNVQSSVVLDDLFAF
jgi:AAA+ ATPase superfamily predicted ATPase